MEENYKQAKEDFVSGTTGSSITHINAISLVALTSVALYAAVQTRSRMAKSSTGFFASWVLLILPMLSSMTVAAEYPRVVWLSIILAGSTGWVLRMPLVERGTPLPSSQKSPARRVTPGVGGTVDVDVGVSSGRRDGEAGWRSMHEKQRAVRLPPLPALTTYRAHMMLMTVLAILAVDFPVFPRSLAKCETFGVSLMDLGVGSFVFSQGVVSAIPLIKDPRYLRAPLIPKLLKVVRKSLPIIALGIVRVLLVKGTEYPEHVTEYGVHWNFFITLALLPVLQVLLHPLLACFPISNSVLGVAIGVVQQIALSEHGFGLQNYVLLAPRTSVVSMNKEGLVSLLGYLSIHLLGLSTGTKVLPPTPSFYGRRQKALAKSLDSGVGGGRKRRNSDPMDSDEEEEEDVKGKLKQGSGSPTDLDLSAPRQLDKTATELCGYSIVWWALFGVARLTGVDGGWRRGDGGVSRRMVNISYIFWIAAFNVSFLLCYVVVLDLWIYAKGPSKANTQKRLDKDTTPAMVEHENPPRLLEAINDYGLSVFLLANVLTGLINLSMSTMYMSDAKAMFVLSLYSMVCCAVPWFLSSNKRKRMDTSSLGVVQSENKYK
ncbi:GPI-anchored wall transfer protein 1 [Psilocybe cubensis]|uniref:GPI-anchored wall transfer protein 1 n=2 Tax=Psilocybe cubensis TaxID=181762 RepID=A0ACB8GFP6_PSICU|nr:GPI-anchored wall transfer protein 1 [Psilocybe cubensis]KAH9474357.1 GPI-anchored wall transfer protein 1 [Psilocybe cubensis]